MVSSDGFMIRGSRFRVQGSRFLPSLKLWRGRPGSEFWVQGSWFQDMKVQDFVNPEP
jgi:hypothetical protein